MYKKKKIVILIPARKGSKRLPKKNFLQFNKKPLICWTINEALKSMYADKIFVSSDMAKILNLKKKFKNILFVKRPRNISQDSTTTSEVVIDFINKYNDEFDYLCLLQPTSPLRKSFDIDKSIKLIINNESNSLVSVSALKNEYPLDKKNNLTKLKKKNYYLNGAIFISKINFIKKFKGFLTNKTSLYVMPKNRSVDIDNHIDFKKAEKLYR